MESIFVATDIATVPVVVEQGSAGVIVVLAHGAGSHMDHKTVLWLGEIVKSSGASLVRFNFGYRTLGRSLPDPMPKLVSTYRDVLHAVKGRVPGKMVIGGHSMGGRVASMLQGEQAPADGLLLFGYPLHPPQRPEKPRIAHLPQIHCPTLQLNGTNDEFCTRPLMDEVVAGLDPLRWRLHWIEGADHSYTVKRASGRTRSEVEQEMRTEVQRWLSEQILQEGIGHRAA
jgi:predicted alpha/beta-hydrolase family hydrolase